MRDQLMKAALPHLVVALLCAAGCASSPVAADGPMIATGDTGPGHTSGMPGLGAHALKFYEQSSTDATSIATPTTDTQSSGSTIIVSVGRGIKDLFSPPT